MTDPTVPQGNDRLAAAMAEVKRLDPLDLLALYYLVGDAIPVAEFPHLILGSHTDEDGEATRDLTCPHCAAVLTEDMDGDVNLIAVDTAERWTTWASVDYEDRDVQFSYDSSSDYQGFLYRCGACQAAVRLPEGWTER